MWNDYIFSNVTIFRWGTWWLDDLLETTVNGSFVARYIFLHAISSEIWSLIKSNFNGQQTRESKSVCLGSVALLLEQLGLLGTEHPNVWWGGCDPVSSVFTHSCLTRKRWQHGWGAGLFCLCQMRQNRANSIWASPLESTLRPN